MNGKIPNTKSVDAKAGCGTRTRPYSQKTWFPPEGDTIPTETLVVQYGYIPMKAQIERMIQAGRELDVYRKEYYDFEDDREIPEGFEDPTRSPNYDPVDGFADMRILARKIKAKEAAASKAGGAPPKATTPVVSDEKPVVKS